MKSGANPAPAGLRQVGDGAGMPREKSSVPGEFQSPSQLSALGWGSAWPPVNPTQPGHPQALLSSTLRSRAAHLGSSSPDSLSSYLAAESMVLAQLWLQVFGAGRVTAGERCHSPVPARARELLCCCSTAAPQLGYKPPPSENHQPPSHSLD